MFDAIRSFDIVDGKYPLSASLANYYFERYTSLWIPLLGQGKVTEAIDVMKLANQVVWDWEGRNRPYMVHKGTPYFFTGQSYLIAGNIDLAFLMVHNAIEEDKRNHTRLGLNYGTAPANSFASLNFNIQSSSMYGYVQVMKRRLDNFIAVHNQFVSPSASFTYQTFEQKFLLTANSNLDEVKFFFVYCLSSIINLETISNVRLLVNAFTRLRNVDLLFNLSLIVDKVLQDVFQGSYIGDGVLRLLRQSEQIPESTKSQLESVLTYQNGNPLKIDDDPDKVIPDLLSRTVRYRGSAVSPRMASLVSAWNLRNYGAHTVGGASAITSTKYRETLELLMSALFFAVASIP
jgi:hypothetical protein